MKKLLTKRRRSFLGASPAKLAFDRLMVQYNNEPELSAFAAAFAEENIPQTVDVLTPEVPVTVGFGSYREINQKNIFGIEDITKAHGGKFNRIKLSPDKKFVYQVKTYGLEYPISDDDRKLVEPERQMEMNIDAARSLTYRLANARIQQSLDFACAAAAGNVNDWTELLNNPDSDIILFMQKCMISGGKTFGAAPNTWYVSQLLWCAIQNHPKIKACLKSGSNNGDALNIAKFQALLGMPLNIIIEGGVLDTAGRGKSELSLDCVLGFKSFLFYRAASPSRTDGTWLKTFTMRNGATPSGRSNGMAGVESYRDESCRADIYRSLACYDLECVNPGKGKIIQIDGLNMDLFGDLDEWPIPEEEKRRYASLSPVQLKAPDAEGAKAAQRAAEQAAAKAEVLLAAMGEREAELAKREEAIGKMQVAAETAAKDAEKSSKAAESAAKKTGN